MAASTPTYWFIVIPSVVSILAIIKTMLLIKENKLLSKQLTKTAVRLDKTEKLFIKLQEQHGKNEQFQKTLKTAALTTQLQQPRLQSENANELQGASPSIPEKYGFIHNLAKKGMGPKEIASVLSISTDEAKQLFTLARIAQPSQA